MSAGLTNNGELCNPGDWRTAYAHTRDLQSRLAGAEAENERLRLTADSFWATIEALSAEVEALRFLRPSGGGS